MKSRNTKPQGSSSLPALLEYEGHIIHGRDEMLSLTDMWRAAGSDKSRQPSEWLASADAKRFIDALALMTKPENSRFGLVDTKRGGNSAGTWAHWQIALAYAKYLSPDFHMWCNTVVRDHMEGRPAAANLNLAHSAREARLFLKQALGIGKIAGLTGNQLLIAASRSTKKAVGFDMLDSMGMGHLIAPVQDPLIIPSKIGADLGISAVKVNHLLQEIGFQTGDRDHKDRTFWKLTPAGEEFGGTLCDVERSNGTGQAQQLKWPSAIVDALREHMKKAS